MITPDMTDYWQLITERCQEYMGEQSDLPPVAMAEEIMKIEGFPLHSPHHHYLVPAVLLTWAAIREQAEPETLAALLQTAQKRGKLVPGAACGELGVCGAGVGSGIFAAVWLGTTPLDKENLGTVGVFAAESLKQISAFCGPRCCKRVTLLALESACSRLAQLGFAEGPPPAVFRCGFSPENRECIHGDCPYFAG